LAAVFKTDGSDLIKREKKKNAGRLQWTDGGAMAELGPSSPEFDETASPTTI
jgi:predicted ATPase